jgi:hypothetical protein
MKARIPRRRQSLKVAAGIVALPAVSRIYGPNSCEYATSPSYSRSHGLRGPRAERCHRAEPSLSTSVFCPMTGSPPLPASLSMALWSTLRRPPVM